jgi:phytol kinase
MAIFTAAFFIQHIFGLLAVILFGCVTSLIILYAVSRGSGNPLYDALARESDSPEERLLIILPLTSTVLGGLISNLFFPQFAPLGYLACGWGDAAGELIGVRFGKRKYKVPPLFRMHTVRTLEGSAAVFLTCILAILLGLFMQGIPIQSGILPVLFCSAILTLIEAWTPHGLDNLTLQVAASGVATILFR